MSQYPRGDQMRLIPPKRLTFVRKTERKGSNFGKRPEKQQFYFFKTSLRKKDSFDLSKDLF